MTLALLLFSLLAFSQETFTFNDIYQSALKSNESLKSTRFELLEREARVSPLGSLPDPILGFEVMDYAMEPIEGDKYKLADKQITLSQMFPMWGKRSLKESAAKNEASSFKENLREKEFKLKEELLATYLDLYLAFKKIEILDDKKKILEQMIAVMRTEYSSGMIPKADLLSAQTEHANLLGMEIEAHSSRDALVAKLKSLVGKVEFSLNRPAEPLKPNESELFYQVEKLFDMALTNSPSILSMKEMESAKTNMLSMSKREYLPDVELMAGYTMREPSMMNPDAIDTASVKIAINIPLYAFTKQRYEHRAAIAAESSATAARKNEELLVRSEIESMSSSIKMLFKKLDLYDGGLIALAHQSYASNRAAYSTRKLALPILLQSINIQFDTDYMRFETLAMLLKEIARLERVVGVVLTEEKR